jgi:cytoskeletal protein RodZ
MLRKRREAMGATLAEVETATKIRQKYLAALEADEWQLLPGEVVGRGFLRNYATYLGLDANELVERRRAVADPGLSRALLGTSAGSALPPPRQVDYRPKDVPLHEEQDGIEQRREINPGPILAVVGMVLLLLVLIWGATVFGGSILNGVAGLVNGVQGWTTTAQSQPTPTEAAQVALDSTPTATATLTPTVASESNNVNSAVGSNVPVTDSNQSSNANLILVPTATPTVAGAAPVTPTAAVAVEIAPTAAVTPTVAPTETPLPSPTPLPTDTPAEPPTPTPTDTPVPTDTPAAAAVAPPFCADARSVIFTPGQNEVISGDVAVTGRAIHEAFQYYKLEFAPGAGAAGGFVYFAGGNSAVDGGVLGVFSSGAVGNGQYTLLLTVVDQTGNFPPPCQVTVIVQN